MQILKPSQSYYVNFEDDNSLCYGYICEHIYGYTNVFSHTICKVQSSVQKSYTLIRQKPF